VPHDLWPVLELPTMRLDEIVAVLLFTCGQTYKVSPDGTELTPMPIAGDLRVTRHYPPSTDIDAFRELVADCDFKQDGNRNVVQGPLREIGKIELALWRNTRPDATTGMTVGNAPLEKQRFTHSGKVDNAKLFLIGFAQQTGLTLRMDEDSLRQANVNLEKQITVNFQNATAQEVLKKVLTPLGATFNIRDNVVTVTAR